MQVFALGQVKLYFHRTWEVVKVISGKCDLVITMNITRSCLKAIADRERTICYFVSCYRDVDDLVKERYYLASCHLKLYRTSEKIFVSTANLSLSNWLELTVEFPRTVELDEFISQSILPSLKLSPTFLAEFH